MEVRLSDGAIQNLIDRASFMSEVLKKWESEISNLDPKRLSTEDLIKTYGLLAKQQMEIFEFTRKMMLLPQETDRGKKVEALVDRLLTLSEGKLSQFEEELRKIEMKV